MKKLGLFLLPLSFLSFFSSCNEKKEWYQDNNFIDSLTKDDVGLEKEVMVNGLAHKVRLIGIDHDDLVDELGEAHTTWEFVNLISDSDGYSLATPWYWQWGDISSNDNFPNSDLRRAIDGLGGGCVSWYQKSSTTKSTTYTKPVIDMLPGSLKSVLKEVKKPVALGNNYDVLTYNSKLFPLSVSEMVTGDPPPGPIQYEQEGKTYDFYAGVQFAYTTRIKHQVKWHDGAAIQETEITDYDKSKIWIHWDMIPINFAGYNNPNDIYGGKYWTRSPCLHMAEGANSICENGKRGDVEYEGGSMIWYYLYGVAPAFCLGASKK
ncbi:MAG: hypothetical protein MJ208_01920 [Bacilli bacterium]|nr:hypothetical protein [Bacilli bacterium]